MQKEQNTDGIREVTWAGFAINLLLFVIKLASGLVGHSRALVADAVHSLSDLSTDLAVILGVKFWAKPPDQRHPYGHNRIEILISAAIGIVLLGAAIGLGYEALVGIREKHATAPGWIAFTGALVCIIVKEVLYRKTIAIGRKTGSSAVIANAWHHRTDALSSIPVALAVAVAAFNENWAFIDHIGAFVVSLFIIRAGWSILRKAVLDMVDTGVSEKRRKAIEEIVRKTEGVRDVHAIRTRSVGPGIFVDLHILVDPNLSIRQGHDISTSVKRNLLAKGEDIMDVVVHTEPYE